MTDQSFINIAEASKHLGVSEMFLRRRCRDSWDGLRPRFYRIGGVKGRLRFRKAELDSFMEQYEGISGSTNKETVTATE